MIHQPPPLTARRGGVVLFAVLVVLAILLLVGYQYFNLMRAEHAAAIAANRVKQARHLADSGIHYVQFVLAYPQNAGLADADDSILLSPALTYDNPGAFGQRLVASPDGAVIGAFSIVSLRDSDDPTSATQLWRYGVEDEGGKLNLNAARQLLDNPQAYGAQTAQVQLLKQMLSSLPGGSAEIGNALLNWNRPGGTEDVGEAQYYASLGYAAKGGPFETIDEALWVRGVSPRLLYGNNRNRNGTLENIENDSNGTIDPGLQRYLTVFSRELNIDSAGQPRININNQNLAELRQQLLAAGIDQRLVEFICQYRVLNGGKPTVIAGVTIPVQPLQLPANGQPLNGVTLSANGELTIDYANARPTKNLTSLCELIGAQAAAQRARQGPNNPGAVYRVNSPLQPGDLTTLRSLLPVLMDKCTTIAATERPARINVNTAPVDLLRQLPGVTDLLLEQFLQVRPGPASDLGTLSLYRTPAWLITEAGFSPEAVQAFEPFITTYSQVWRFQVVGYFENGGPAVRLEAIVDANRGRPRVLYWRDITELGRGFPFGMATGPTALP